MRIIRNTGNESAGKRMLDTNLYHCTLLVRRDFTVSSASEYYYAFVGENSALPFTDLVDAPDAEILRAEMESGLTEPVELYTQLSNRLEEGYRNVYLYIRRADRQEKGEELYEITITDWVNSFQRVNKLERNVYKYRHFLTLCNLSFFEYTPENNRYVVYRYVNEKALQMVDEDLDVYLDHCLARAKNDPKIREAIEAYRRYLKGRRKSFELDWLEPTEDGTEAYAIRGGVSLNVPDLVEGIVIPNETATQIAYYLTPAGRDAHTGLLNKRAATEYAIEKLSTPDEKVKWLIIIDIDDFKNVNDSFGHAFGDEVIGRVADTLQANMGGYGVVGRFGGDEFFVLLHGVETREDLKLIFKVVTRDLMYAFDDKFRLTLSIGVSQYPKDGRDFETLFGIADKCLYIAKEKGKNRHIIYNPEMHGAYTQDSIKSQAVSYIASRSKRREMLARCVVGVNKNGVSYFLNYEENQQGIIDVFDLDGITIYGDYGRKVLLRRGNYAAEPEDRYAIFADPGYAAACEHEDILVISTISRLKAVSRMAYDSAVRQEIGAFVRCIIKKDGRPYVFVDFDILNTNRKWSDPDIDMLMIFGSSIGELIKNQL